MSRRHLRLTTFEKAGNHILVRRKRTRGAANRMRDSLITSETNKELTGEGLFTVPEQGQL